MQCAGTVHCSPSNRAGVQTWYTSPPGRDAHPEGETRDEARGVLPGLAFFLLLHIAESETDRFETAHAKGPFMETKYSLFPAKEFIKGTAEGALDLEESKSALRALAKESPSPGQFDMLMDLREAECELSVADVFELVQFMFHHRPSFLGKIAVLVHEEAAFDKAKFLELCAENRGLHVHAFLDLSEAEEWLGLEDAT